MLEVSQYSNIILKQLSDQMVEMVIPIKKNKFNTLPDLYHVIQKVQYIKDGFQRQGYQGNEEITPYRITVSTKNNDVNFEIEDQNNLQLMMKLININVELTLKSKQKIYKQYKSEKVAFQQQQKDIYLTQSRKAHDNLRARNDFTYIYQIQKQRNNENTQNTLDQKMNKFIKSKKDLDQLVISQIVKKQEEYHQDSIILISKVKNQSQYDKSEREKYESKSQEREEYESEEIKMSKIQKLKKQSQNQSEYLAQSGTIVFQSEEKQKVEQIQSYDEQNYKQYLQNLQNQPYQQIELLDSSNYCYRQMDTINKRIKQQEQSDKKNKNKQRQNKQRLYEQLLKQRNLILQKYKQNRYQQSSSSDWNVQVGNYQQNNREFNGQTSNILKNHRQGIDFQLDDQNLQINMLLQMQYLNKQNENLNKQNEILSQKDYHQYLSQFLQKSRQIYPKIEQQVDQLTKKQQRQRKQDEYKYITRVNHFKQSESEEYSYISMQQKRQQIFKNNCMKQFSIIESQRSSIKDQEDQNKAEEAMLLLKLSQQDVQIEYFKSILKSKDPLQVESQITNRYQVLFNNQAINLNKFKDKVQTRNNYRLDHSNITVVMKQFLKINWQSVQELNFKNCKLTDVELNLLLKNSSTFPSLRTLILSNNSITNLNQHDFKEFKSLKKIILVKNPLSFNSKQILKKLKQLGIFHIC